MFILQSVHIGNVTAEAENGNARKNGKEWRRRVHSTQQKTGRRPAKRAEGFGKKAEQDGGARAKPSGWTCGECLQWFPERDSYVSHVKAAHAKVRGRGFHPRAPSDVKVSPRNPVSRKLFLCFLFNSRQRNTRVDTASSPSTPGPV